MFGTSNNYKLASLHASNVRLKARPFLFFGTVVIAYNELKNDFMGRLELNFGGIDCEFGGLSSLASTSVQKSHDFF